MVTRGYPSLSFPYEAAEELKAEDKPAILYYFGDFDPSGIDIPRKVEAELRRLAPDSEISFSRIAVTESQIKMLGLPTRPTKQSDSRAKGFGQQSVEVDAIPASHLRHLAEQCISRHVNEDLLAALQVAEESERSALLMLPRDRWVS